MTEDLEAAQAERLRASARRARQHAVSARELALDIERRREQVLQRGDASVARHTPATWSSRAATTSRTELQRGVGFSLWSAAESLRDTRVALERHASHHDSLARTYENRAAAAVVAPAVN